MPAELLRHRKNDFILNRIGILKLIDQHRPILSLDSFPDSGMRVEETSCPCQQTVKRQPPFVHERCADRLNQWTEELQQITKQTMIDIQESLAGFNESFGLLELRFIPILDLTPDVLAEPVASGDIQPLESAGAFVCHVSQQRQTRPKHLLNLSPFGTIVGLQQRVSLVCAFTNPPDDTWIH